MAQYGIWNGEEAVRELGDEVGRSLTCGGKVKLGRRICSV